METTAIEVAKRLLDLLELNKPNLTPEQLTEIRAFTSKEQDKIDAYFDGKTDVYPDELGPYSEETQEGLIRYARAAIAEFPALATCGLEKLVDVLGSTYYEYWFEEGFPYTSELNSLAGQVRVLLGATLN
jgi:hypothetical protein